MRNFIFILILFAFGCKDKSYYKKVNTFIGTNYVGNTYPGANSPFGMVQLSPDNGIGGWNRISGYYYKDSTIAGFSHTHLSGTGAGDLYDISFMPVQEPYLQSNSELGIYAKFSHNSEKANAGYYSVILEPYNIKVELTTTERCGIQKYTFSKNKADVFLNLHKAMNWDRTVDTHIEIVDSQTIRGYRFSDGWARNQKIYFETRFSKPFKSVSIDTVIYSDNKKGLIARFHYEFNKTDKELMLVSGISGVDEDGAYKNIQKEANHFDFNKYRKATENNWNKELGRISVESTNPSLDSIFYTALYHSMLCPTIYSDVDNRYRGADSHIHKTDGSINYSTFSLWDTYRASHPLYNIISPSRSADMVKSLIQFGEQNNGHLPVWNMYASETDMMIGYHSVSVIVDAILRGIVDVDTKRMIPLMISTAERNNYRGLNEYRRMGYVPFDKEGESLSKTLEYAYDDAAIAAYGKYILNKKLYDKFKSRANSYINIYDKKSGFFRPKDSSGKWIEKFNPYSYTKHITESNAWHYLFSVQHDIDGLIELMGGENNAARKLDSLFTSNTPDSIKLPIFSTGMIGQYAHGNEPVHHYIFIYNKLHQPWKTAYYANKVMKELYKSTPDGLCGNEDCGQMSSWYVFASMGLYPLNPISGQYEISSPMFKKLMINLENGKKFQVTAPKLSEHNIYIKSVKINGKAYHKSYVTYEQIMAGGHIELEMTNKKGYIWYD